MVSLNHEYLREQERLAKQRAEAELTLLQETLRASAPQLGDDAVAAMAKAVLQAGFAAPEAFLGRLIRKLEVCDSQYLMESLELGLDDPELAAIHHRQKGLRDAVAILERELATGTRLDLSSTSEPKDAWDVWSR